MCVTGHQSRLGCCGEAAASGWERPLPGGPRGEGDEVWLWWSEVYSRLCVCVQSLLARVPVWMNQRGWWASPVVAGATAGCFICSVRLKWPAPRRKGGTFKILRNLSNLVFNLLKLDLLLHKGNVVLGHVQKDIPPLIFFPFHWTASDKISWSASTKVLLELTLIKVSLVWMDNLKSDFDEDLVVLKHCL